MTLKMQSEPKLNGNPENMATTPTSHMIRNKYVWEVAVSRRIGMLNDSALVSNEVQKSGSFGWKHARQKSIGTML